jgi:hypothetical protein
MSAERRADVPAPRAGPRSLSLAWVEREEGCNKVREFRWLSSKGSLTTSPLLVCPSLFLLSLSLSSLPFRLGKPIRSKTTLFRPPPLLYRRFPNPPSLHTRLATRRNTLQKLGVRKRRRKQQRRRLPPRNRDRRATLDLRHPDRPRLPSPVAQACRSRKFPQATNNKLRCLRRCRRL